MTHRFGRGTPKGIFSLRFQFVVIRDGQIMGQNAAIIVTLNFVVERPDDAHPIVRALVAKDAPAS